MLQVSAFLVYYFSLLTDRPKALLVTLSHHWRINQGCFLALVSDSQGGGLILARAASSFLHCPMGRSFASIYKRPLTFTSLIFTSLISPPPQSRSLILHALSSSFSFSNLGTQAVHVWQLFSIPFASAVVSPVIRIFVHLS